MAKSIMHDKYDGTCYLCMMLNNDYQRRTTLQEHHAVFGNKARKLAERYGLKVYLCIQHHTAGPEAVHTNHNNAKLLQREAQRIFEEKHSHEKWMEVFGENYL